MRSLVSVVDDDESVRESLPDLLGEFGFAVQAKIDRVEARVPVIALWVRQGETIMLLAARNVRPGNKIELRFQAIRCQLDFSFAVGVLIERVLIIEPGRQGDFDGVFDRRFGLPNLQLLQFLVIDLAAGLPC